MASSWGSLPPKLPRAKQCTKAAPAHNSHAINSNRIPLVWTEQRGLAGEFLSAQWAVIDTERTACSYSFSRFIFMGQLSTEESAAVHLWTLSPVFALAWALRQQSHSGCSHCHRVLCAARTQTGHEIQGPTWLQAKCPSGPFRPIQHQSSSPLCGSCAFTLRQIKEYPMAMPISMGKAAPYPIPSQPVYFLSLSHVSSHWRLLLLFSQSTHLNYI